jgi:peroxiredoxin (alkyl hydroperoxide reductase subunit C)
MTLVGKKAPLFTAGAVVGGKTVKNFKLEDFIGNQHVVLMFYTKDFSSICPSEMHAFQAALPEFEARNTALIAISTDSEDSHLNWLKFEPEEGGIKGITYPLVGDMTKTISDAYGVLAGEYEYDEEGNLKATGPMISYRAIFLIDKKGIVQYETVQFFTLTRNVDDTLRMIDVLQHLEENGVVCPANWKKS